MDLGETAFEDRKWMGLVLDCGVVGVCPTWGFGISDVD